MIQTMIGIITKLLVKSGITWFPKKKAEFLVMNGVVKVTRCDNCKYVQEYDTPNGIVFYCPAHEHSVPADGFCHEGLQK